MTKQNQYSSATPDGILLVPANKVISIVTFTIGEQMYGLPIAHVLEILFIPTMLVLANAPPQICGLLNRRGHYLPVVDGRTLLGQRSECSLASKVVVVGDIDSEQNHTPRLGLLVDHVHDVCSVAVGLTTTLSPDVAGAYLTAVINGEAGSILLFDVVQLTKLAPHIGETTGLIELTPAE
jgi:purine-binding chemotaxis protein CheW